MLHISNTVFIILIDACLSVDVVVVNTFKLYIYRNNMAILLSSKYIPENKSLLLYAVILFILSFPKWISMKKYLT